MTIWVYLRIAFHEEKCMIVIKSSGFNIILINIFLWFSFIIYFMINHIKIQIVLNLKNKRFSFLHIPELLVLSTEKTEKTYNFTKKHYKRSY